MFALAFESAAHQRAVHLLDAVRAERVAQPLPHRLLGPEEHDAGGIDIEPVRDAAAQAALADTLHFRMSRDEGVQQRAGLLGAQRVHRHAGGLVERHPTRAAREHGERLRRFRDRATRVGRREIRDRDATARLDRRCLVASFERASVELHRAGFEQAPHASAADAELLGEPDVETPPGGVGPNHEFTLFRLAGFRHHGGTIACSRAAVCEAPRPVPKAKARNPASGAAPPAQNRVQVMDTTLRDGEQTPDVSYTPAEKLQLAKVLLSDVGVDRIEIAQTRVSEGERLAARRVAEWARKEGVAERIEIMGYCDGDLSVKWIKAVGGRVMNLLTKGSEKHCREQLRQSPEQHRKRVTETILAAHRARIAVNVYLEDWSNGVRDSFDYVFAMVQALREVPVERIYLPDTLGAFSPEETARYVGLMTDAWRDVHFEFHAHNDYGLAVANCMAAVRAGARGVHTSVNGMGERAGNTRLAEVVAALHDHTPYRTGVVEAVLVDASRLVETFSGKTVSANSPIVGRDVFTQTGGIHADGDAKGDLYANRLVPKRFGRARQYALGKLAGKASLIHNLKTLGIELTEAERALVLERIVALGDKKSEVAISDLPYIIADVLDRPEQRPVHVASYRVVVDSKGLPEAEVEVSVRGETSVAKASGDGGYDAFMRALEKAVKRFGLALPRLADYRVRIPPGGKTGALVQTVITWQDESSRDGTFSTLAVDSDQLGAAVLATEKMLNAIATRKKKA